MPVRPRLAPALLTGALAVALVAAPSVREASGANTPGGAGTEIEDAVHPAEIAIGQTATVSGTVREGARPVAGLALTLTSQAAPRSAQKPLAETVTASDGSFSFAPVAPTRNALLDVHPSAPAVAASTALPVWVDPRIALAARSLGPGRTRLSMRVVHTPEAAPATTTARWYVAAKGTSRFAPVAVTPLRDLSSGVGYASVIVDPPARSFRWKVCINPRWEATMGPPAAHGPCPDHAFTLAPARQAAPAGPRGTGATRGRRAHAAFMFGGEATGTPAPPFPSQTAIAAAESWLDGRAGATALAVVDSSGRLSGIRTRSHFETASVIKVMFLAAYLKRLEARHRQLAASDTALLYPMIHESNNEAASAVLGVVGERAVERVAGEAGMRDYAPGVGWWAFSQTSAADQAQLLWRLGEIMPRRYYPYARYLMSSIEPEQSWGFPPVARPRWQVYFKTGALPSRGLFNEVARLERGGVAFSVAVLSDHDPSQAYGEETIAGVARALLGSG